ncbi:MAG: hypothetical protein LBR47_07300 [Spirochaetaceae bacterium]|jgi:hypothetical protein|nr:hypothetical protein [Spirochaetaceae bacterium]
MLIDKTLFNYVTYHTIEHITLFLKEILEGYGFTVRLKESGSTESFYLHITYNFHQFYKEIRVSNHAPNTEHDYDISASFDRPGAINCHEFLLQFLDSLNLPYPVQTMNYKYTEDILKGLKSGKLKMMFPENTKVKAVLLTPIKA